MLGILTGVLVLIAPVVNFGQSNETTNPKTSSQYSKGAVAVIGTVANVAIVDALRTLNPDSSSQ